jgi:uncharacterized protein YndB with AHSA1/START domain
MNRSIAGDTITEEVTINAPADQIFAALTSPEERVKWWGAEGRFKTTHMESDLRPKASAYRIRAPRGTLFISAGPRYSIESTPYYLAALRLGL